MTVFKSGMIRVLIAIGLFLVLDVAVMTHTVVSDFLSRGLSGCETM